MLGLRQISTTTSSQRVPVIEDDLCDRGVRQLLWIGGCPTESMEHVGRYNVVLFVIFSRHPKEVELIGQWFRIERGLDLEEGSQASVPNTKRSQPFPSIMANSLTSTD